MAGNKENMRQAMKELLGLAGVGVDRDKEKPTAPAEQSSAPRQPEKVERPREEKKTEEVAAVPKDLYTKPQSEERRFGGFMRRKEEPVDLPESSMWTPEEDDAYGDSASSESIFGSHGATTVISAGTSIFGDIRSEGEVEIRGRLKGNLEAAGNVRITGKVLGDVKGDGIELVGCVIQGNITATSNVKIDSATIVVGDITAASLTTDGKIKGSIQVENSATFQKNAVLAGNVTAGLVSMTEGARIQGAVRISQDNETNALFGEDLEI